MTPPPPGQNDETARSRPTNKPATEQTAVDPPTGGPTDATVIRGAPAPPPAPPADEHGTNFGRYELVGEIARGGMGVVYRARQHGLDRVVALKMILGTDADREAAQRFLLEARAAAALDHPNVVPVYDIDESGGRPYFTMALIDGPNLRGYVEDTGLLPIPAVLGLFAQVVAGVAHAHARGIVHRDLKPANVLIDRDGRPRVTDFGLAKRSAADAQLTATGQVVGTPAYMAPEQARDSKEVGPPADVYSLGAILYFLLTGRPPFHASSVTDLLIQVVMEPPAAPRGFRPDVPADVEALCLRCLAKLPADRFVDAQELAAALRPILDQHLSPSANLSPSAAGFAFDRGPTTPSFGSFPGANTTDSIPSLGAVLPRPAAPAPNRKPLLIALGAAAVVLLAVAGFLATRDKKPKPPTADGTPPPADAKPGAAGDRFAWPAATRADFGLTAKITPDTRGPAGTVRLEPGTVMKVHLTAARDCYVSVWVLDPAGGVTRLLPNEFETDTRLLANRERVVGEGLTKLTTTPTDGAGHDRLRVLATTTPPPPFPAGTKQGEFTAYLADLERERVADVIRGVVVKKGDAGGPLVSEAEVQFRVQK